MSDAPHTPPPEKPSSPSTRARFGALSPTVQATILSIVAMIVFSVVPPSVRALSDTMDATQIVFIRAVFGVIAIGPI